MINKSKTYLAPFVLSNREGLPFNSIKDTYLYLDTEDVSDMIYLLCNKEGVVIELLTHYKDQSGGYYPFSWSSTPSYIGGGAAITGRWVEGSLSMTPQGLTWKCSISFEKSN